MNIKNSDFLSSKKNTSLSNLRGNDLLDLLYVVENFAFEYRKKLFFDEKITFGTEIEYEHCMRYKVNKFINYYYPEWYSKKDRTCNFGGEIASRILNNDSLSWKELYLICAYLRSKKSDMYHKASSHVHVTNTLVSDLNHLKLFLKLYTVFEPVYFRFACGEIMYPRKTMLEYARPIAYHLYKNMNKINEAEAVYLMIPPLDRRSSVNFDTKKDTIEFRLYNGTKYATIHQNNINLSVNSLLAPSKNLIDEEYLDYRLKNNFLSTPENFPLYFELLLHDALLLADSIFDNNLDKIYFLRQYIKTFNKNGKMIIPEEKKKILIKK